MIETRIYCDRCKKQIRSEKVNTMRLLDFEASNDFEHYHLCGSCTRGLRNFLSKRVLNYNDISKEDF